MERPKEQHFLAAKIVVRYVQGTLDYGVQFTTGKDLELIGYVDRDYAGCIDDCRSTSGYVFMLGGDAISWNSKKQPIVRLSTTEAEYAAAAYRANHAIWLKNVLEEIGVDQRKATVGYCDNRSTIKFCVTCRSKHIEVRYHFLREVVSEEKIKLEYCTTHDQLSDITTKAVKLETFERIRTKIGVFEKVNKLEEVPVLGRD